MIAKEPYAQDDDSVSLQAVVEKLLQKKEQMFPPKFRFDICKEAAEFNFDLLKENNFELEKLLNPTDKCVTSYGSEFKSVEDLAELLHRHPRWEAMKEKLEKAVIFQSRTWTITSENKMSRKHCIEETINQRKSMLRT